MSSNDRNGMMLVRMIGILLLHFQMTWAKMTEMEWHELNERSLNPNVQIAKIEWYELECQIFKK